MSRCAHEFVGSNTSCLKCGWTIPIHFPTYGRPQLRLVAPPVPAYTVTVPCISCDRLGEHDADAPIFECHVCESQWIPERWRTAEDLIAFIRAELSENQDQTRRAFYNAGSVLFCDRPSGRRIPEKERGPMKALKMCYRCGAPNHARLDWCGPCGALLPSHAPPEGLSPLPRLVLQILLVIVAVATALVFAALMSGCGEPFRAELFSATGAGGDINKLSEAGAGGREEDSHGDAGQEDGPPVPTVDGGAAADAGGGAGQGGASAGASGAGVGGRGMGEGGAASGAGGGGNAGGESRACLEGWRGSSCDVCSSAAQPASGESCAEVLDCYQTAAVPAACEYARPTMDLQVELARAVAACRCGGGR